MARLTFTRVSESARAGLLDCLDEGERLLSRARAVQVRRENVSYEAKLEHADAERDLNRKKMLVAYDLGLGKTVLTIAALEKLMDHGDIDEPGLVICLSSLKYQWASQITKFSGGSSTPLVIDGTPKQRQAQYSEAMNWMTTGIDYVILNYEQVVNDWDYIKKLDLQDPANRRMINADDKLKAVFNGKSKVSMFEMTKLVSGHLK